MDRIKAIKSAERYASEVRNILSPAHIILYGSYAKGNPRPGSDIDIAVIFNKIEGDYLDTAKILWKLTEEIDDDIEPVLLFNKNDPSGFIKTVRDTGIEL